VLALGSVVLVAALGVGVRLVGSAAKDKDVDWRLVKQISDSWREGLSDQWEGDLIEEPPSFAWTDFPERFGIEFLAHGATRCVFRLPSGHILKLPLGEWGEAANDSEAESWYDSETEPEVRDLLVPIIGGGPEGIVMEYALPIPEKRWDELGAYREKWSKLLRADRSGANTMDFYLMRNWGLREGKLKLLDYESISAGGG
jgi:hypothetical protein